MDYFVRLKSRPVWQQKLKSCETIKILQGNGRDIAIREFDEKVVAQKYIEIYRKFIDV